MSSKLRYWKGVIHKWGNLEKYLYKWKTIKSQAVKKSDLIIIIEPPQWLRKRATRLIKLYKKPKAVNIGKSKRVRYDPQAQYRTQLEIVGEEEKR